MASINNVVRTQLLPEGQAVARDNMNVTCIMTSSQKVLSTNERYSLHLDIASVESKYGASSKEAQYARAYFGTSPNPVAAGGVLVIGYWRAADEDVAASAAKLVGEQLSAAALIPVINQITDGSFDIDVDGATVNASGLDFSVVSELSDIVPILDGAITGATVSLVNDAINIVSDTTGATSTLSYFSDPGAGTYIGDVLGLSSDSLSTLTQGEDASAVAAEEKIDAISAVKSEVNIKGAMFIDRILDAEVPTLSSWSQANDVIMYEVFSGATYLEKDASNPVWNVRLASRNTFRCLLSKAGNRKLAATYMARVHTVNFNGQNTAITLNLKTLNVPAEFYTQTEIQAAKEVGLDVYTTIKESPVVLCSPANDFVDNPYNLIAYQNAVQVDAYNLLKTTPTKVPQTTEGVDTIEDTVEKTTQGFVRAGVFAPGTWTLPDFFGNRETFLKAIETQGYYVLAGDLADQPTADRQQRKSPVIQVAVKNAGAVHEADIIISFNL